ncbi:dihydrodipicolinate synthase family protein [Zobellia amurskyensis]|uniref:Dihydrodipicolinate synthase family protein n=1 Tax=Zobellia amurskyensis TaxID=248905 RepID=A0A7X2ZQQ9_9FLAO|nr:dihydrodipicolinate synthase family protein [Zobellia amurskyensis]MUH34634.1 dihydrodipicolinate synthase family protein [Zobellia amurskyensis]
MKKELYPLHGIVTVLNTPFTKDNTVDIAALKTNVTYAIEAGVKGFLVPAMAAEVYKLSATERLNMVAAVLEESKNIPVIAGIGAHTIEESKKLLQSHLDLGCKNVLFQIPYSNDAQFESQFAELASLGPEMIMLQDWDFSGDGLSDSLIANLFEKHEAFRCLKIETVPAGVKYSRILELTKGHLNLSGGWAVSQMIEGLKRGVHAFMPTGMHYIYTEIYQRFQNDQTKEAIELFNKILPVLAFSNQHLDISIHFFKRLLFKQGIYSTPNVRTPISKFDKIHQKIADKHIRHIIELEYDLKLKRNVK